MLKDKIKPLINAHVRKDMPDEIKRLAAYASADLNFGPAHHGLDEDYPFPGFSSACETIAAWTRDNIPFELWVDLDCEMVFDRAPEGYYEGDEWIEPFTEDTYQIERKEILQYVFGDIGEYVR